MSFEIFRLFKVNVRKCVWNARRNFLSCSWNLDGQHLFFFFFFKNLP